MSPIKCPHCGHERRAPWSIGGHHHCEGCGIWYAFGRNAPESPGYIVAFRNSDFLPDYDCAAIVRGYVDAGYSVRWEKLITTGTRSEGVMTEYITAATPVVSAGLGSGEGGIHSILRALGVDVAQWDLEAYPEPLRPWLGRRVFTMPMVEIMRRFMGQSEPLFVKSDRDKTWFSAVLTCSDDLMRYLHVHEDNPVLVSEVVQFVAEWRVFVVDGEVWHVAGYKGDPLARQPHRTQLEEMAAAVQRRAWSFDVGLTDDGRYLLVEAHTALCLGQYGLGPHFGQQMHLAAWEEAMTFRVAGKGAA